MITFLEQMDLYLASKNMIDDPRRNLIRAALIGPAKTAYRAAVAAGTIRTDNHVNEYADVRTWLLATYHTNDIKQGYKDQLSISHQTMDESPMTFYTRICNLIDLARYADTVKDQVAESAFMNRIFQEIKLEI